MFVSVSAEKDFVLAVKGGVGRFLSPHTLKSLNIIEKIQPRMMCTLQPCKTIICYYSPTNVNDEMDVITFYKRVIFPCS